MQAHPAATGLIESSVKQNGPLDFVDRFERALTAGRVVGSCSKDGIIRKGIDKEGVLGIDNGALRIQALVNSGWGRSGIAYGPYTRQNGLAFGVFLVNGHNISRTEALPDGFKMRLWRWAVGPETAPARQRLRQFLRTGHKRFMWRRLKQWFKTGTGFFKVPPLDENLAVGWFPSEAPTDPLQQGNALVVHAIVPEGGELWARTGPQVLRTARGLQNVPVYYFVVLRERGAAYYAASLPGAAGLNAHPTMRLLAIDAFNTDQKVYAGIHQSVLGEIGFRAETRVYGTQVAVLPEYANWFGSAQGADSLVGAGPLHLSAAETGGSWKVLDGDFRRTEQGLVGAGNSNEAVLELASPVGLVYVLIETGSQPAEAVGLIWRAQDEDNFWCFEAGSQHCQLSVKEGGRWSRFPAVKSSRLLPSAVNALQVFDDGENLRLYLNGDLVYGTALTDQRFQGASGVGLRVQGNEKNVFLRAFEAHPRDIPVPASFDLGKPWVVRNEGRVVVEDQFAGPAGDLAGHRTSVGDRIWRRDIGQGVIALTGHSAAKVQGTVERPCPGRTAYTVDWVDPGFADVEVTITPPGKRKWLKERGRAGLMFWQDERNHFMLSAFIGDWPAMSMAAFFMWDGFEELYDAVWTNVGNRMHWGVPHDLRVVCDGQRFMTYIDREPILYRALSDVYPKWNDFQIRRVGIVANWEWGNDTGSVFQKFVARDRA